MAQMKSYRETPYRKEIESNCVGYERFVVQNVLNSKDPKKVFERKAKNLSKDCRRVVEKMVK